MEKLTVKRKEYDVINQIDDKNVVVTRKGKTFDVRLFDDENEFYLFVIRAKKINSSGITNPKIVAIDKKLHAFVTEHVDGETILEMLVKEELPEELYNSLFQQFWYAKADKLGLDYHGDNWIVSNGKLYYVSFNLGEYTSKEDFLKTDIKQWFLTKEFVEYAQSKGLTVDGSHLESEYAMNKRIALISLKYYR